MSAGAFSTTGIRYPVANSISNTDQNKDYDINLRFMVLYGSSKNYPGVILS